jgi:hypothetical protein
MDQTPEAPVLLLLPGSYFFPANYRVSHSQFEMVRRELLLVHRPSSTIAEMHPYPVGLDPATPVACQQWTGLIAINYPARAFGITRHMDVHAVSSRNNASFVLKLISLYRPNANVQGS